jgi:chemotaxis protein methyltransferase CheR
MYTPRQLNLVRELAYHHTGISLGSNKDVMIANRLDKLKRSLEQTDIDTILQEIAQGEHLDLFISSFTTNKTSFFREDFHFEDLKERVATQALQKNKELQVYCSAASTGEEPYSIVMAIESAKKLLNNNFFNYSLIATDIDLDVLHHASKGVYEWNKSRDDFPSWIQASHFFKRKPHHARENDYLIKVKDELRNRVKFEQMNLMMPNYPFKAEQFDVVFCRNVLIYFSQEDQNSILKKLFKTLKIGGTLYLGHSESPLELHPYLERYGQNIFVKTKECV